MSILSVDAEDTNLTKTIKETISTQYLSENYNYQATDDLMDMGSLLYPRFKLHCVNE